ncbi:hypothetical protein AD940_01940 [Gluconobacter thailandicus]|nr:hypothetical protein AD940_01940 [Gluconobacter thailandicus]
MEIGKAHPSSCELIFKNEYEVPEIFPRVWFLRKMAEPRMILERKGLHDHLVDFKYRRFFWQWQAGDVVEILKSYGHDQV